MSNPYMRSALMDEMEQGVKRPGPGTRTSGLPVSQAYAPPGGGGASQDWEGEELPLQGEANPPPGVNPVNPALVAPPSPGGFSTTSRGPGPNSIGNWANDPGQLAQITGAYGSFLGREPGQDELASHYGNPGGLQGVLDTIKDSPEARTYAASTPPPTTPPPAPAAPPSTAGALGASGATAGRYSGFDFQRAQDPSKSAKDAFAAAATASGSMPGSKDEAESWFNTYILKAMTDAGYAVDRVVGDKAFVRTRENPGGEWIDFLINAGGENPEIGWQSEISDPSIGAEMGSMGGGGGGSSMDEYLLGDDSATDDIDAAIQKLLESGMSFDEILQMLQAQGTGN